MTHRRCALYQTLRNGECQRAIVNWSKLDYQLVPSRDRFSDYSGRRNFVSRCGVSIVSTGRDTKGNIDGPENPSPIETQSSSILARVHARLPRATLLQTNRIRVDRCARFLIEIIPRKDTKEGCKVTQNSARTNCLLYDRYIDCTKLHNKRNK